MKRNIALTAVILLVIFCLVLGILCTIGAFVLYRTFPAAPVGTLKVESSLVAMPSSQHTPSVTGELTNPSKTPVGITSTPGSSITPSAINATPGEPTSTPRPVPSDIASQMDAIQQQVSQIRGLQPVAPVQRALLTTDELKQKVKTDFFGDYSQEEARDDVRELAAMGLLEPDFDLYQLYIDLYSEQIAGYYDPETKQMYVVDDEGFKGTQRMTYAHEYTHTLQDQNFDMQGKMNYNDKSCETETEYCAAVSSLIEGDAMLTEYTWFYSYTSPQDQQDVISSAGNYQSPVYDSAPTYLKEDFLFPYLQGQTFVQTQFNQGGYPAINAAYKNPPVSTEQILHPEKYPNDKPVQLSLPDLLPTLGSGWRLVEKNVLGEWYTYLVLADGWSSQARLSKDQANLAAEGWGGDEYQFFWNDEINQGVFVLRSRWESDKDVTEFWQALQSYGTKRWGDALSNQSDRMEWDDTPVGSVTMLRTEKDTLWVSGPDRSLVNQVVQLTSQ